MAVVFAQLISVQNIKDATGLHANVDDKLVSPEIMNVQEIHLRPLIGKTLYERLCDATIANTLNDDEKFLLRRYVRNVIAYYVLAEMPSTLSYQFFTAGVVGLTPGNGDKVSYSELDTVRRQYKTKAEQHASLLQEYLNENASSSKYPQYLVGRTGRGDGEEIYSCPIFLG